MNLQQNMQSKSTANGIGRRRPERDLGAKMDSKFSSGNFSQAKASNAVAGGKGGLYVSPSRDRIIYLSTCLVGQTVEVQLKSGSIYAGTCYTTNAEKDFAIILKMARIIKDVSFRGQKSDSVSKAPSKTLIIPGKEVVQVIAKDVNVSYNGLSHEFQQPRQQDLMIDSFISKNRQTELGRELAPWVPEEDDPKCPELENIFDNPWNRGWDQFETNEALFGVKSTFDEELYTTKLERGPWMRDREKEAIKIAREIEGEDTEDLHLAEERNMHLHETFDVDEETRYSSVYRGTGVDDSGFAEDDDEILDLRNTEPLSRSNMACDKISEADLGLPKLPLDDGLCSQSSTGSDLCFRNSYEHIAPVTADVQFDGCAFQNESRAPDSSHNDDKGTTVYTEKPPQLLPIDKMELSEKVGPSTYASDQVSTGTYSVKSLEKPNSFSESVDISAPAVSTKGPVDMLTCNSRSGRPSSSASSNSDQEFKLNPNAKSFTPSRSISRTLVSLPDSSMYYPGTASPLSHMHGMQMGLGVGPSFPGHQPVMYNHSVPPMQASPYFHPSGSQYGQQMIVGHPRQVLYMPASYQPELPYKGREF